MEIYSDYSEGKERDSLRLKGLREEDKAEGETEKKTHGRLRHYIMCLLAIIALDRNIFPNKYSRFYILASHKYTGTSHISKMFTDSIFSKISYLAVQYPIIVTTALRNILFLQSIQTP